MTLSRIGRFGLALVVSVAVGLGMTACGGGTVGYMWVVGGTQNSVAGSLTGQIAGFKIDNYTGNLTSAVRSPFASGGNNPSSIVIKSGGRFVYVINTGTPGAAVTCPSTVPSYNPGSISVFSVGGDGTLTFQNSQSSQGCNPVWAATDSTGNFLYVLDQKSPAYGTITNGVTDLNGDITVFAIDPNTGRLALVTNAQIKNANGTQIPYFEVGPNPIMMRVGAGCVYTLDQGDHTIFPYSTGGSGGQLTLTTNSLFQVSGGAVTPNLTSINFSGQNVYLTDAANNQIIPLQTGANCALNSAPGGAVNNYAGTSNPVYSFSVTASSNTYLYVLNQSSTSTLVPNSSISAFVLTSDNHLTNVAGGNDSNNPYPVGSGPVCAAIDPTNQYIYISNGADGTVTGKLINVKTGQLSGLARGSTFPAVSKAGCLAISPNVQ